MWSQELGRNFFKISLDKMENTLYFCTPFRKEKGKQAINGLSGLSL